MFTWRAFRRALGAVIIICGAVVAISQPAYAVGSVSIADATVAEGTGGTRTLQFTVTVSVANVLPVTVNYATSNGSATSTSDYTATSGQLTIPVGATSAVIPVDITTDAIAEPNETIIVTISNPSSGTVIGDGQATGTVTNDDGLPPALSVNDPITTETDAPGTLEFTVSVPSPALQDLTVGFATSQGTAASGTDFGAASGTATIAAGASSTVVVVSVVGDDLDEADETLSLTLSGAGNATIADASGTGTIIDDDALPGVQSDAPSVGETDTSTSLVFTVTLDAPSGRTATVDYSTSNGTAVAGADYTAVAGTLFFGPGDTTESVTVPVTGDDLDEPDETVLLNLGGAVNATVTQASRAGTIVDDEATPAVSISDLSVTEGPDGTSSAQLTLTLSAPSGQTVTVNAATDTGTATPSVDYQVITSTTASFDPGAMTSSVTVPILGDVLDEYDETVPVVLSAPSWAVIADGAATLTILDDDATPSLSLLDGTVTEGSAGNVSTAVTLSLSAASGRDVTVSISTSNGTATGGADYATQSGTVVTIPAGSTTADVSATVFGDLIDEADETFTLNLANPTNAVVTDGTGVITILDDDSGPTLGIGDATQFEGSPPPGTDTAFTFTITLSAASEQSITVSYATADATATAGATDDYDAVSGVVTFSPGQTTRTVTVNVNRDLHAEPAEAFLVGLSSPTNAVLAADTTGVGTITNDDGPAPSLSIADVTVDEGAGTASLTALLSQTATQNVVVDLSTSNGSATAPDDYATSAASLTIPAGQSFASTTVVITEDAIDEPDETFSAVLTNARNAGISDGTAMVTITDNDSAPTVSIADTSVTEGSTATLTVSLTRASSQTITVQATSADGTALAGTDYTAIATQVTFAPGQTSAGLSVGTIGDSLEEPNETVTVELSAPTGGAVLGDGSAILTIVDDDAAPTISIADATHVEGDSGTAPMTFTVTLSAPSAQAVTVRATASDVTTTSADHGALDAVLTFAPGDTSEPAAVQVTGDTAPEANESLVVTLSQPSGGTIADGSGAGSIQDDDAQGTFTPLAPVRLLDTRTGLGRPGTTKLTDGEMIGLDVTGIGGIPASGVAAVALNVTVTEPDGPGFVTVTPSGGASTSNVNYAVAENVANLVIVPVGPDGNVRLLTSRRTHLVADAFGWFATDAAPTPGSHFVALPPTRLLDTRTGLGAPGGSTAPAQGGSPRVLDVTGAGGVPASGVTAVVLNVTVTEPTATGFLSVTPSGDFSTSNMNFVPRETVAGLVIVPVHPDGSVRYAVGFGSAHVVADVLGWFGDPGSLTGSVLTSVEPARLADTRDYPGIPLGPQESGILTIAGAGGVPATGVSSAVINLTVDQPTAPSYLTATPDGTLGTSNLNFVANQTVANLAIVPLLPADGAIDIFNFAGEVHVIVDVFAWFSTPAP